MMSAIKKPVAAKNERGKDNDQMDNDQNPAKSFFIGWRGTGESVRSYRKGLVAERATTGRHEQRTAAWTGYLGHDGGSQHE
jgi:hypothetical protein